MQAHDTANTSDAHTRCRDPDGLRTEDIAVAVHFMLTKRRRTAVCLTRVETRRKHE